MSAKLLCFCLTHIHYFDTLSSLAFHKLYSDEELEITPMLSNNFKEHTRLYRELVHTCPLAIDCYS